MGWSELLQNRVLMSAFLGWLTAQVVKVILSIVKNRSFSVERLYGGGGMPSSHSCMVSALAVSTAMVEGINSTLFALTVAFAFVTIYDAMGVRRQAGIHAKVLNKYAALLEQEDLLDENELEELEGQSTLKELIGHTPMEVMVGAMLGILIAIVVCIF